MQSYIQLLANDLRGRFGSDMSRVAVVFTGKRTSLFLNQALAAASATPVYAPEYITISDLFRRHSPLVVADHILLVCRLYDVFVRVTGYTTETLDRFYSWGELLLSDFDDIDKNMADAGRVFQVVTDLHALDDVSYLNDEQRAALSRFFGTLSGEEQSAIRDKFLRLWSNLGAIYTRFRAELRRDGLAYEGMLYRDVAESEALDFGHDTYCFVGFNMLHVVEQRLFQRLKDLPDTIGGRPRALFYWDYDTYYLSRNHEAGHFIGEYISRFPDALGDIARDNLLTTKRSCGITYVSSQTETLQARYVHDWLLDGDRWRDGARTAIVLCDERLLQTVIRSLPKEVERVNITTGFPLQHATVTTLIEHLLALQIDGRAAGSRFRFRQVAAVLRHPYIQALTPSAALLLTDLAEARQFFPSRQLLARDEALALVFSDEEPSLAAWLLSVVRLVATRLAPLPPLDSEAIYRACQILQRIAALVADGTLRVEAATLHRLIRQVVASTTVPYHGEPLEGIQIMGVLETRCLDFDHILVLSANEGNMPKGVDDSSFIPHSVRRAYGLTTVEHKVGIYSYYFHRLIQRSADVTLAYNSSTEGLNVGEMSRFMTQLMVESGLTIHRRTLLSGQEATLAAPTDIVKDETVQRQLERMLDGGKPVSPTSLARYLTCQVAYYYRYVADIREADDEEEEELDSRTFGLIFHAAAQMMYSDIMDSDGCVSREAIVSVLADPSRRARYVDEAFRREYFHIEGDTGASPKYNGLAIIHRRVVLRLLKELLAYDREVTPLSILGLECAEYENIPVNINGRERPIVVGGYIDRLDMVEDAATHSPTLRVIDYKTGFLSEKRINVDSLENVFEPGSKHAGYFLQALMYSSVVSHSPKLNPRGLPVSPKLLYVQNTTSPDYTPDLCVAKAPIADVREYDAEFRERLAALIAEIHNPEIPFSRTHDRSTCEKCEYRELCHA